MCIRDRAGKKAGAAPAALSATSQLIEDGVKRVNMYSVPKVSEDVEVPAKSA